MQSSQDDQAYFVSMLGSGGGDGDVAKKIETLCPICGWVQFNREVPETPICQSCQEGMAEDFPE